MGRKQTYSVEVKLQAVELYLSGEMGGYRRVADAEVRQEHHF